ncbi:OmpA family protein [Flaviaesturariibacter amylovorans]|uniref:OmpA family protein n=1 Tax=Flaviaesturariibacter amylovorans TaxID=1084520 RepID=A0ABP8HGS6_9BACT
MSRVSLTVLLLAAAGVAAAQSSADLRLADRLYSDGDHYNAALRYEQYLGFRRSTAVRFAPYSPQRTGGAAAPDSNARGRALSRLAECYYLLNDHAKAAGYYAQAAAAGTTSPADQLRYAVSLRATGRSAEATPLLLRLGRSGAPEAAAATLELQRIDFARAQERNPEAARFQVAKMKGAANSGSGNYAAAVANGTLYFTSSRRTDSGRAKGPALNHLFEAAVSDTAAARQLPVSVPGATDVGLAAFTADGRRAYFTAWSRQEGRSVAAIYTSSLANGQWSAPVKLNAQVNLPGTSNAQPCIVETTGKSLLFFSSDRPGGVGGYDLWYAPVDDANHEYGAHNAGAQLNTAGDEGAPFYHRASATFVYASNGLPGMGGFDLYGVLTQLTGKTPAFIGNPRNLGAPVNSVRDDSYFYSTSPDSLFRDAYFSSDRASDCCLELYTVSKDYTPKVYKRFVTGTITKCGAGTPLAAAVAAGTRTVAAGSNGTYHLELDAAQEGALSLTASLNGYGPGAATLQVPPASGDTTYVVDICLPARERAWQPILFDFDKDTLTVLAQQQLDLVFGDLKEDPSLRVQVGGYTDGKGGEPYNDALAQRRAQAVRDYLWKKGIDASRLEVKGFGECCPVAPERTADGTDAPAARRINRRVELRVY